MATANLTKTFDDECCISENTTTIESLVKLETLKQYTDDPDQLPNADLLIYIMNTETDVHKVVPFTNRKLENLTDYHYFSSLTKIHNNKSPTFQSLEKHPSLGANITCLKIPDATAENVHKCVQFISDCAEEKLNSREKVEPVKRRFGRMWILADQKNGKSVIEAYTIFVFLGAQVYADFAEKYLKNSINPTNIRGFSNLSPEFEKYCKNYVDDLQNALIQTQVEQKLDLINKQDGLNLKTESNQGLLNDLKSRNSELESRCETLRSLNFKNLCRSEHLGYQNKKITVQNKLLKSHKSESQRQISLLKHQHMKLVVCLFIFSTYCIMKHELENKPESLVETKNVESKNKKLVSQNKALELEKSESDSLINSLKNKIVQLKSRSDRFDFSRTLWKKRPIHDDDDLFPTIRQPIADQSPLSKE